MIPPIAPYVSSNPSAISDHKYAEAATGIFSLILLDTITAAENFYILFQTQRARPIKPFADHNTRIDELTSSFAVWVDTIHWMFAQNHDCEDILKPQHRAAIANAGFIALYEDIILWPDFFAQSQRFIDDVLVGLASLIALVPEGRAKSLTCPRAPAVWASIWRHRSDFIMVSTTLSDIRSADMDSKPGRVLSLLSIYRQRCKPIVFNAMYTPHIVLHIICTSGERVIDLIGEGLGDMITELLLLSHLSEEYFADDIDEHLIDAVVHGAGLDVFCSQFGRVLRCARSDGKLLEDCVGLLWILCSGRTIDVMPYVAEHQLMSIITSALAEWSSVTPKDTTAGKTLYVIALRLLNMTTKYYLASGIIVTQGEDVVTSLSACINAIVDKRHMAVQSDTFENSVLCNIQISHDIVMHSKTQSFSQTSSAILVNSMRAGARAHWWPTLAHLRKAIRREPEDKTRLQALSDIWKDLGSALGLKVKPERERHEEEARRTACSWRDCPQRRVSQTSGRLPTRKCAACGEVRYCSGECQTMDWKDGGHKARCGKRLKN